MGIVLVQITNEPHKFGSAKHSIATKDMKSVGIVARIDQRETISTSHG